MTIPSLTRRRFLAAAGIATAGTLIGAGNRSRAADGVPGRFLFARSGSVWQWQSGDTEQLLNDGAVSEPRWSPDGSQFIFVRTGNSFSDLYLRSLSDGSETQLTYNQATDYDLGTKAYVDNSTWVVDPSWSASGVIGYASDYFNEYNVLALWVMNYAGAFPASYPPAPGEDGYIQSIEGISLSGDGSVAGFTSRRVDEDTGEYVSYVGVMDLGSGESGVLADDDGGVFDPALEPNGTRVAVSIRSGETTDIWLIDRDGGDRTQVTNGANATKPCWSSDGAWLAYMQMVDFKFEVWAVTVQGATIGAPQKIFNFDDIDAESGLSWFIG
jgi:TolB protein